MWQKVKSVIRRGRSFLITTHVFPDGDAVGSQLALGLMLRKLGKKTLLVAEHPLPKVYRFLDPAGSAKVYSQQFDSRIEKCDAAFSVDVSTFERLGRIGPVLRRANINTVCIDHPKSTTRFAEVNVVDKSAASSAELIYSLAKSLRVNVTPRLAKLLFVATATDTGWFRFANTTPRALRVAAELVQKGARPNRAYQAVYETLEWQRMALMERALGTLRSDCNGRIAHLCLTRRMLRETGAKHEDAEDFVNIPRALRGVQLIILFREVEGGIKVSLRSKGGPSVEKLARKHGGGGHANAAGAIIKGPLNKVMKTVLADARRLLTNQKP